MAASLGMRASFSSAVAAKAPRRSVACNAAARPLWLPGAQVPSHLNGTLPGDFGFDPLGLGKDPKALIWYQAAELVHCRTAMTAVAGILFTSVANKLGLGVPEWFEAGKVYYTKPDAIPFSSLFMVQMFLCGFVEVKRYQDIIKPGSQGEKGSFLGFETAFTGTGENGYPGGIFDPMGLAKQSPELTKIWKLREVKNGRLAMLAFIGFCAQYSATGRGPLDNLAAHLADPWHTTFAENGISMPPGWLGALSNLA